MTIVGLGPDRFPSPVANWGAGRIIRQVATATVTSSISAQMRHLEEPLRFSQTIETFIEQMHFSGSIAQRALALPLVIKCAVLEPTAQPALRRSTGDAQDAVPATRRHRAGTAFRLDHVFFPCAGTRVYVSSVSWWLSSVTQEPFTIWWELHLSCENAHVQAARIKTGSVGKTGLAGMRCRAVPRGAGTASWASPKWW